MSDESYIFCPNVGLLQNISVEDEDFLGTWFPGSLSLSQPGDESYQYVIPDTHKSSYTYQWWVILIRYTWYTQFLHTHMSEDSYQYVIPYIHMSSYTY